MERAEDYEPQEAHGYRFVPLIPGARFEDWDGPELAYVIQSTGKQKAPRLMLSLHPDLMRTLEAADGELMRLDLDREAGVARLVCLAEECPSGAARKAKRLGTGRGNWTLPWTGPVAEVFPKGAGLAAVTVLRREASEVLFKLPGVPGMAPLEPSAWSGR